MMKGKTVFITGGAGFIGSTLARRLSSNNQVVIFDNLTRNAMQHTLRDYRDNIRFVEGDILDVEKLGATIADARPTHVVHCAAIAGIDTVVKKPVSTLETNVTGTVNVLRTIHRQLDAVERVVLFSTSEVFGPQAYQSSELTSSVIGAVGEARWSYAVSKLVCEHLGLAYYTQYGMPTVVLRPFNVYGPGQVGEGALSIFIQRAIRNQEIQVHGDGNQIRAWCYVDDMVDAVALVLGHDAAIGQSFNIGNARAVTTIYGLASTVIRLLNSVSSIRFVRKDYADIELRVPDVNKARALLNYEARIDLEAGIPLTAEYYHRLTRSD
jgi:UDP-glucose 4-epimerase